MKIAVAFSVVISVVISVALSMCLFFLSSQASAVASQVFPAQTGESMQFAGIFTNTMVNVSGQITIELTINADDTIEGNVNFTQFTGGLFACGSGDFVGTKQGETIELNFTSDSVDPACGFYQGVTFTIEAALLNNTSIHGNYSTDTGQQGIVDLRRIFGEGVYMPFIKQESE